MTNVQKWLPAVALCILGILGIVFWQPSLSTEDQRELNYLNSTLHDLDEPSAANAEVRRIECTNADKKAERYLKVNTSDIHTKVTRYLDGCKKEQP